jgi:hypothetical protein
VEELEVDCGQFCEGFACCVVYDLSQTYLVQFFDDLGSRPVGLLRDGSQSDDISLAECTGPWGKDGEKTGLAVF